VSAENASVLVVDDNKINLKVALAFLARHGITSDSAGNGLEAIRKVQQKNYDLVFMDHMMPDMDGIEATRRIRAMDGEKYKNLPIVALSANAVTGANETFLNAGMNGFISKPIDPNALNRALLKWLPADKVTVKQKPAEHLPAAAAVNPGASLINKPAGLEKALGDEDFYKQLLSTFRSEHGLDAAKLLDAAGKGDRKLAHRIAHTLKSTSALIGAGRLRRIAYTIETALGGKDIDAAMRELGSLETEMAALLAELKPKIPADGSGGSVKKGKAAFLRLAETLLPLLTSGSVGSLDLLPELRECLPDPKGKGALLVKQIDDFEFTAALETLRQLQRENGQKDD
jgi:CheY-like chemotaxis protein